MGQTPIDAEIHLCTEEVSQDRKINLNRLSELLSRKAQVKPLKFQTLIFLQFERLFVTLILTDLRNLMIFQVRPALLTGKERGKFLQQK